MIESTKFRARRVAARESLRNSVQHCLLYAFLSDKDVLGDFIRPDARLDATVDADGI